MPSFRLLFATFVLTGTVWAATDPFEGTWELNPQQSKLIDEMKIELAGPNKYTFIFSGDNSETIVADGTDQPGTFGTTFAVSVLSPLQWKVVRKSGGHITISAIWELSPDGKTLNSCFWKLSQSIQRRGPEEEFGRYHCNRITAAFRPLTLTRICPRSTEIFWPPHRSSP